ncbi:Transmembrane protease serine 9 [Orchesella cincta]|uniref:Transmembrane protease serine 9 n=1 Tax=Orchesella cincta TaxID=48709 RepID=A0A1D2MPF4_ORCCI|nr:Transmembrane protease serine 9 [Orchesella cincta]
MDSLLVIRFQGALHTPKPHDKNDVYKVSLHQSYYFKISDMKGDSYQGQPVRCGTYPLDKNAEYNTLSHDYPQHYPPGQSCVWQFLGAPTCYPFLKCSNFTIVESYLCQDDYLALSDGFDSDDIGKKFCGKTSPTNFVSQTSILLLTFKSDIHSHGELGFNCTVSCFKYEPVYGYGNGNRYYYQRRPKPNLLPTSPQNVATDCDCGFKGPLVEKLHHFNFNTHSDSSSTDEEVDISSLSSTITSSNAPKTQRSSSVNDNNNLFSSTSTESPTFTSPGKYRWMGYLSSFRERKPLCGCTVINNLHVLTAAHCVTHPKSEKTIDPRAILVVLNDHNFANFTEMATVTRYVAKVIRHPLYNPSTYDYDVAVLKLTMKIELNRRSEPILRSICLPPRTMASSFTGQNATVTGWGRLTENGPQLTTLQESELTVTGNEMCNAQYSGKITSNMICAGLAGGEKDSCVAEPGSPLMKREYSRYVQIGVATYGRGCTKKYSAGVNSRVTGVLSGTYPLDLKSTYIIASNISASTYYWEFLGTPDCFPAINCPIFLLKQSYPCLYDFMTLSDGSSDDGMKFCGNNGPKNVLSQTTILIVSSRILQSYTSYYNVIHPTFACSVSCAPVHAQNLLPQNNGKAYAQTQASNYQSAITWIPNTPPLTTNCDCGVRGPLVNDESEKVTGGATTLIVGGTLAKVGEYRMQIAMVRRSNSALRCGGTLLNNLYVLTAAHCCLDDNGLVLDPEKYAVLLNTFDISHLERTHGLKENIIRIDVHPLFSPDTLQNDCCLLKLEHPVNLVSQTEPILRTTCLPRRRSNDRLVGTNLTVTGWGATSEDGDISKELLKVEVTVISNEQCNKEYDGMITDAMLCAASPEKDSCQGDSGGPAFKEVYGRYMQVGITSFGEGCARPGFAGVYARVAVLNDWIRMTAREGVWCRGLESYNQHYDTVPPAKDKISPHYALFTGQKPKY